MTTTSHPQNLNHNHDRNLNPPPARASASESKSYALLTLCLWLVTLSAFAGTHTWTGGSTSGLWSTPSNWENNDAPVLGESPLHLVFPTNATRRLATNNFGGLVVSSITFDGAAYTLAGLGAGTNLTVDSSVGHSWWNIRGHSGTGHTVHYSLNLLLDGNLEFNISTNANVVVRSRLSAATAGSGLSKDGPGSVYLDPVEDNTFDGTTMVIDGLLRLEGSHVGFGGFTVTDVTIPGPLIIGGTSPSVHPNVLVWQAEQIADSAAVTVNQNGELNLADVNETVGSLIVAGGYVDSGNATLKLNGNVTANPSSNGQPGDLRGHLDLGSFGRFFTVASNGWLDVSAIISGGNFGNVPAGVTKNGLGLMSLHSSSNTFGGDLYVSAGTLSFTSGKQLGAMTNSTGVASNATLVLTGIGSGPTVNGRKLSLADGSRVQAALDSTWDGPVIVYGKAIIDVPTNTTFEIGGVISGVGGFNKVNSGELLLTGFDNNTFTGTACVDEGQLSLDKVGLFTNAIAISGPLIVGGTNMAKMPKAVLFADEEITLTVPVIVNRNGQLLLGDHDQTVGALAVNGGFVDSGTFGVLNLAGDITSTNALAHNGKIYGSLNLGNSPRSIFLSWVAEGWLEIHASISGGPVASLTKTGGSNLELHGTNSYQGLTLASSGTIVVANPNALGSPNAGTVVADGASLALAGYPAMTITGEALSLSGSGDYDQGALVALGTNVWDGVVTLQNAVVMRIDDAQDRMTFSRRLEGPGGIIKVNKGKLIFAGVGNLSYDNTYAGSTVVLDGELLLIKDNLFYNTSVPGALNISPAAGGTPIVRVLGKYQFGSGTGAVTVEAGGQLSIESPTFNAVGSLAGGGVVNFVAGSRLVAGLNNQSTTFAGTLQGGGINDTNLSFQGGLNAIFTLAGANTLAGKMEVTGGTMRINSAQPAARIDVKFQGTLGGTGSVNVVTMRGGYLAPGSPVGKFHAASCAVTASHSLHIDLNGANVGTGYDQFEVDAAPNFGNTQLGTAFGNGFNPSYGQEFMIVRNNSALPIAAPFQGLAEGATFYVDNTHRVQITYLGGDGNDVVLKTIAGPGQLKSISSDGNRITINGCGTPGALYGVQATTNVADSSSWIDIGNIGAAADGLMQFVNGDVAIYPQRFYRFVAP